MSMLTSRDASLPRAVALDGRHDTGRLARALRAPAIWLAALVGASIAVRWSTSLGVHAPWILPDEIVYSELAKSIAAGDRPSVRGVPVFGWGEVYPTLLAPAWAFVHDPELSYRVALLINAVVMSLAAIPAYLLARMFVSRGLSIVVALMTVLVPSMAYTGVLMTENACYTAFVLALWLLARVVREPSGTNQALALVGLGLVAFTRIQSAALLGAYAAAVVVWGLTAPMESRRRYFLRFWPTAALLVPVALAPVLLSIARGDGPLGWLGSRSGTFDRLELHELPQWVIFLVADLVIYVAVIPAVASALLIAMGLRRTAAAPVRLFSALASSAFAAMLLSVGLVSASLDVDGTENLNERYVFYVVPLLFVGLALWVQSGLPRPRRWSWALVAVCCLLAGVLPIERLVYNANFQSVALVPWLSIGVEGNLLTTLVAVFALGLGVLWIVCRPDRVGRLWLAVAIWMVFTGVITTGSNQHQSWTSSGALESLPRTWIDDAVPDDARVDVLWRRGAETRALVPEFWIMENEFFNRSVRHVYRLGPKTYYEIFLPTVPVRARGDGVLVDQTGREISPRYLLVTCRTPVEGRQIAQGTAGVLQLVDVRGRVRLVSGPPCSGPRRVYG